MASKIKQVAVYAKVTLTVITLAAIAIVIVKNWQYKTKFWPGADTVEVPTLWLMAATSIVSVILLWFLMKLRSVFKELAQVRTERAAAARLNAQKQIRHDLDEQERRIDDKLRRALDETKEDN